MVLKVVLRMISFAFVFCWEIDREVELLFYLYKVVIGCEQDGSSKIGEEVGYKKILENSI